MLLTLTALLGASPGCPAPESVVVPGGNVPDDSARILGLVKRGAAQ